MEIHPVLIAIPSNGPHVPPRERIRLQREAAALALDESARLSGLPRLAWQRDAQGVPIFERGVFWSLSHKPTWACGVVCVEEVGIDVEVVAPRKEGLWEYVTDEAERARVPDRDWPAFFRFWTAKEAVLKARRAGLARLDECRIVTGPTPLGAEAEFDAARWSVQYRREGDALAAVATRAGLRATPVWSLHPAFASKPVADRPQIGEHRLE